MTTEDISQERMLRENSLSFFGAITASVSHELNNVISIIDQTAGLLEDLLYNAQKGQLEPAQPAIPNERLQRIADKTLNQTQRGISIIKRLNAFAHSVDDPVCEFEVNSLVENLINLCLRFADMKKVHIETQFSNDPINITNSPLLVQQALYLYFRRALAVSNPDETIIISTEERESCVNLSIESALKEFENDDLDGEYYNLLMERINGTVNIRVDGNISIIDISIPK